MAKSKKPHALISTLYHLIFEKICDSLLSLCFLLLGRIWLVIYLIFKLLEIRQRLAECQLSWCWVAYLSVIIPSFCPVTWNVLLCFSKKSSGTLNLWLSVNILCSGGFFPYHSMLSQVPFLYVLRKYFCIWYNTVICFYFWSRKCRGFFKSILLLNCNSHIKSWKQNNLVNKLLVVFCLQSHLRVLRIRHL